MRTPEKTFSLRNGVEIPALGYGTWKMPEGPEGVQAVKTALELGYRHIDTAACYGNETSVGRGIRAAEIPREDLFVTSKVWNTDRGYDKTLAAFDQTMENLGLDVLETCISSTGLRPPTRIRTGKSPTGRPGVP